MESQLISIPSKKTDMLDWVHPLKNFFTKNYGSYHEFSEEINAFNKLRTDAKSCNKDAIGRDILYRYYGQLELFDLRIPVNGHDGVHVEFCWHDAFEESKSVTQNSIAFEKACILFNLASVLSEIASNALEEKDYKLSYASLQNAAGIFKFISENFLNAPSNDLEQDTIKALEQLMLSQAQEVFLLKILNGDGEIKYSLVAKLAKAAANFYSNSHDLLDKLDDIDAKWVNYCKLKSKLYNSIAYYHQSTFLKDTSKVGEAISFLRQAHAEIEDYKLSYSYAKYTTLETNCKKYIDLVKAELPILEKDNDYIYHDSIPAFSTLTLKGLDSVKSISINDQGIDKVVGKDIFEKIIPYSVHEQSSKYTELAASLLRAEDEKIVISDEELASVLEYLNLPLKLNEIKVLVNSTKDGDASSKLAEISRNDYNYQELTDSLNAIKKQCNDKLNELNKLIDLNNLQYNDKILDIRENISKTRQSLIVANETDLKISNLIKPYEKELNILKNGQVSSYLQNDQSLLDIDIDDTDLKKSIAIIDKNLSELNNLKYEKSKTYKSLKENVHNDDISKILILNKNLSNQDEIFQNEILKFKPHQDRIDLLISKQQDLISSLKKNLKALLTNRNYLTLSNEKTSYDSNYTNLLKTFENFQKFKNGHNNAIKFYRDLLGFINNLEFQVFQILNTSQMSALNLNQNQAAAPQQQHQQQPPAPLQYRSNSSVSGYSGYQPQSPFSQSRQNSSTYTPYQSQQQQQQQQQPPPLPPQQPYPPQQQQQPYRQNSSSIYDQPSSFDPSMYSKFS